MRLKANFEIINDSDPDLGVAPGEYLVLETNKKYFLEKQSFYDLYKSALQTPKVKKIDREVEIGVAFGSQIPTKVTTSSSPDFSELLKFIDSQVDLTIEIDNEKVLCVFSDDSLLLELPWEQLFIEMIVVVREVAVITHERQLVTDNITVYLSQADQGLGTEIASILKEEINLIYKALRYFVDDGKTFEEVHLIKHTNERTFRSYNFGVSGYHHFVMHGDNKGQLWFELDDMFNYKQPRFISKAEFISFLPEDVTFQLFFFNSCYTGGGLAEGLSSLAFDLVSKGYSNHVLAYTYGADNKFAKDFAETYYNFLCIENDPLKAYSEAVLRFKNTDLQPRLFKAITLEP